MRIFERYLEAGLCIAIDEEWEFLEECCIFFEEWQRGLEEEGFSSILEGWIIEEGYDFKRKEE